MIDIICYRIDSFVKDIPRKIRFFWQRRTRGWDDSDTWSLDMTLCQWLLPRLKRFKELNNGTPCDLTEQEWDNILDKMIKAVDMTAHQFERDYMEWSKKDFEEVREGLELLGKWMQNLWW